MGVLSEAGGGGLGKAREVVFGRLELAVFAFVKMDIFGDRWAAVFVLLRIGVPGNRWIAVLVSVGLGVLGNCPAIVFVLIGFGVVDKPSAEVFTFAGVQGAAGVLRAAFVVVLEATALVSAVLASSDGSSGRAFKTFHFKPILPGVFEVLVTIVFDFANVPLATSP